MNEPNVYHALRPGWSQIVSEMVSLLASEINEKPIKKVRHRLGSQESARGDPGYGATSKLLPEVGLFLALDRDKLAAQSGVLTPATAVSAAL